VFRAIVARRWPLVAGLIGFFLLFASRGIWSGYSYWTDELWSVSTSQDSWTGLFTRWLLPYDVHPPAYQLLLKAWMAIFGPSEISTRLMSFLFAAFTMLSAALLTASRKLSSSLLFVAFIGCSPLFAFYAQETRSYEMTLFLAMLVTGISLLLRRKHLEWQNDPTGNSPWPLLTLYGASLLLSLTHYFGWILVAVMSLLDLLGASVDRSRWRRCALLLVISIWPLCHYLNGLAGHTGGSFWIFVRPVIGTISNFTEGLFPLIKISSWGSLLVFSVVLALFSLYSINRTSRIVAFLRLESSGLPPMVSEIRYLALLLLGFLSLVMLIDLHTPISTHRNFIVLLPAAGFLFVDLFEVAMNRASELRRFAILVAAGMILLSLLKASYHGLSKKIAPHMNTKAIGEYVATSNLCADGRCFASTDWTYAHGKEQLRFYFHSFPFSSATSSGPIAGDGRRASPDGPALPFIGISHDPRGTPGIASAVVRAHPEAVCWMPHQSEFTEFIMMTEEMQNKSDPAGHGLVPCPRPISR
jgi:mannosyltransferase